MNMCMLEHCSFGLPEMPILRSNLHELIKVSILFTFYHNRTDMKRRF
jgi:hypothetical protein